MDAVYSDEEKTQLVDVLVAVFRGSAEEVENRRRVLTIHLLPETAAGYWEALSQAMTGSETTWNGTALRTAAAPLTLKNSLGSTDAQAYLASLYLEGVPASVCIESFSSERTAA